MLKKLSAEGRLTCLSCNQSCEATDIVDHFLVQNFDSGIEKAKYTRINSY